jgi:alkanesulfonate monooxygenase SsuD/methylene tetrahydromethanopterin reductase-like flavin-dependent oxidoreductase (luciferase family)
MKFGMFCLLPGGHGREPGEIYRNNMALIELAEELGFYSAWVAEHHFSDYGMVNDPLLFLSAVAVRTKRIRLGTGVMVVPLHNPIRLAENAAFVDQLSGGRLDLGIGRGYQPHEFQSFDIAQEEAQERTEEIFEFMKAAWTQERVDWNGKHYHAENVTLSPKPFQKPHPPVLWAAVSPSTFERLGAKGLPILTSPNFTPIEMIKNNFAAYRTALTAGGFNVDHFDYPLMQQVYVAADSQRGYDEPQKAAMEYYNLLGHLLPKRSEDGSRGGGDSYDFYRKIQRNVENLDYDYLFANGVTFGDADSVVERIQRLQDEVGVDYFLGWFNFGSLGHEQAMASLRRFGEEVIPRFKVELGPVPVNS